MKISKNIPIPRGIRERGKFDNIPLSKLKVGDSVKLCDYTHETSQNLQSIYRVGVMGQIVKKGIPGCFKVGRHAQKELRVWRIK